MAETVTMFGTIFAALAAAMYGFVAWTLARRSVSSGARSAHRAFITWWSGLAVLGVLALAVKTVFAGAVAAAGITVHLTVLYVLLGVMFVALASLLHYLLYIHTANRSIMWFPFVYYATVAGFAVWVVHGFGGACMVPSEGCVAPPSWNPGDGPTVGSVEPRPDWVLQTFGVALVVPPLAAALLYMLLLFRVPGRTAKYRILMISAGIVLWFGFGAIQSLGAPTGDGSAELTSHALGFLSASLVLLAYLPPKPLQQRLGIESLPRQVQREAQDQSTRKVAPVMAA